MILRTMGSLLAGTILVLQTGCDIGPPDPLLFEDDGSLRITVGRDEVDAAGVTASCADLAVEELGETVRVPIEGEDGVELVGVGALALCIDEMEDGGGDDGLPSIDDVGDDVDLEGGEASDLDLSGDGEVPDDSDLTGSNGGGSGSNNVGSRHGQHGSQGGAGTRPPPSILADPTPEPVGQ